MRPNSIRYRAEDPKRSWTWNWSSPKWRVHWFVYQFDCLEYKFNDECYPIIIEEGFQNEKYSVNFTVTSSHLTKVSWLWIFFQAKKMKMIVFKLGLIWSLWMIHLAKTQQQDHQIRLFSTIIDSFWSKDSIGHIFNSRIVNSWQDKVFRIPNSGMILSKLLPSNLKLTKHLIIKDLIKRFTELSQAPESTWNPWFWVWQWLLSRLYSVAS